MSDLAGVKSVADFGDVSIPPQGERELTVAAWQSYRRGHEAAGFMPLLSEVARVQSVCAHAANASLPTDRFAAAH
jgi:hypothetical protein